VGYPERDAGAWTAQNLKLSQVFPQLIPAGRSKLISTKLLKHRCEIGREIELKSARNQLEIATVNETIFTTSFG
jgi:hypothetical protein